MTPQRSRTLLPLTLLLVSLTLAACGGEVTPTPIPPTATTLAAQEVAATPVPPTQPPPVTPNAAGPAAPAPGNAGSISNDGPFNTGNPDADLFLTAISTMKKLVSYRVLVSSDAGGEKTEMTLDIDVASNNSRTNVITTLRQYSVIVVGGDIYTSIDGGNTFGNTPNSQMGQAAAAFNGMWRGFNPNDISSAANALKPADPASETIDGVECRHLVANSRDLASLNTGSPAAEGTIEIWVAPGDTPTVRQMKINAATNGQAVTTLLKWSDFNADFGIRVPTNVRLLLDAEVEDRLIATLQPLNRHRPDAGREVDRQVVGREGVAQLAAGVEDSIETKRHVGDNLPLRVGQPVAQTLARLKASSAQGETRAERPFIRRDRAVDAGWHIIAAGWWRRQGRWRLNPRLTGWADENRRWFDLLLGGGRLRGG